MQLVRVWSSLLWLLSVFSLASLPSTSALVDLSDEEAAALIMPPNQLGTRVDERPLWHVLNGGGEPVGYAFETAPLAPMKSRS